MRLCGLICLIVPCAFAATASADPAPAVFRLTIAGTALATWQHTGPAAASADCTSSDSSSGVRSVRFRTSRPVLVRFVGTRLATATVRGLRGTVTFRGTNTRNLSCAGVDTRTPEQCAASTRSFAGVSARLAGTGAGAFAVRTVSRVRRADCPREPVDVASLGPAPSLQISQSSLTSKRIARITLRATTSSHRIYGDPEVGTLDQRSVWKLILERVPG